MKRLEGGAMEGRGPEENRLLCQQSWDPIWSTYSVAHPLFCQFTFEYWNTFKDPAFQQLTTTPTTLKQAVELWSLKLVEGRVNYRNSSIPLKPSTDGLKHNIPPKSKAQLFSLKRRTFFPEPDEIPILVGSLV